MTLAEALIVLQDPRSLGRDEAMRVVVRWCDQRVRSYLVGLFGTDMADTEMIEQATVHLEIKAATQSPSSRFRGSTEGEAVRWCQTVVRNEATSWWRRHHRDHRSARLAGEARSGESIASSNAIDGRTDSDPGPAKVDLEQAVQWLLAQVAMRVADGGLTVLQDAQVAVFIEHRLRLSGTKEQIANWASRGAMTEEPADAQGKTRARDRVYKDRQRGREVVDKILAAAPAASEEDAEIRMELARILDVSRSSKGRRKGPGQDT